MMALKFWNRKTAVAFLSLSMLTLLGVLSCEQAREVPEYHQLTSAITKSVELDYLLYQPAHYEENSSWPLVLYLSGLEGADHIDSLRTQAPAVLIENGMDNNFFLLVPQLPGDVHWDAEALMALLTHVKTEYQVDSSRIYVTGVGDRGGYGVWDIATSYPDYFAKIAPISAAACTEICRLGKGSVRIYHGALDTLVPVADARNMHFELDFYCKSDVSLIVFEESDHHIADQVYSDEDFWLWFSEPLVKGRTNSAEPGYQHFSTTLTREVEDNYLLYLPKAYAKQEAWPMVVFLHGSGSAIEDIEKIRTVGPPKIFESGRDSEFIVLAPQLHDNLPWDVERVYALIQEVSRAQRVDPDRIYITGLSRGGFGTWELAVTHPNTFAAIAPISAREVPGVERLKDSNVWIFHGQDDDGVPWQGSQFMYNRLMNAGAEVQLSLYEGVGHNAWDQAYESETFWKWMLSQTN